MRVKGTRCVVRRECESEGDEMCGDIVQFVPMRNFLGVGGPGMQGAGLHLAKEVLAEIPEQFLSFMKTNKIVPKTSSQSTRQSNMLPPDPEAAINVQF